MNNTLLELNNITSAEYIATHIIPTVFPVDRIKKLEDAISVDYLDLQLRYRVLLAVDDDGISSYELTESLLQSKNLDMEYIRKCAYTNAWEHLKVSTMAEMLGLPEELAPQMFVITTDYNHFGAGAGLVCTVGLQEAAARLREKELIIIPSSISELIVIPASMGKSEEINLMIQNINCCEVSPDEVLSDHCYYYNAITDTISF